MRTEKQITPIAWLGMLAMGICWGGSFVSIELMLRDMPFETLVALRVGGGSLFLWACVFAFGYKFPTAYKTWLAFIFIGGLNIALPFSLISWGQTHISSSLSGILNATTALFGPIVAATLFRDEKLGLRKALGVSMGFVGVIVIIGLEALQTFDLTSAGQLALIGASLCYALGVAMMKIFFVNIKPQVGAAGMMTGGAIWMIPISLWLHGTPAFDHFETATLLAWAYVSLISSGVAYLIMFRVIQIAGSGNTTLVTLLVVPVAITLGAIILNEQLPLKAFIGFGILALGMLVIDGRIVRRLMPQK